MCIRDRHPRRNLRAAAVLAVGANLIGLGLGPLVAGTFAQYLPAPTRTVFWAYLALSAVAMLLLLAVPETVTTPDRIFRLHLRVEVPANMRLAMLGAMLGTVSYTHLDVYKRQVQPIASWANVIPSSSVAS